MLTSIFTLDYEIHGNGQGSSHSLMVEPTDRMLDLFDQYGAKLTILADVAEILKFKELRDRSGRDDYHFDAIVAQLQRAVKTGHDVQLHLHSSYFNATFSEQQWVQDWSEYNFSGLPYERMNWMIREGKAFLEHHLRKADPAYRCIAFRAANWSASPSSNLSRALLENGIKIDTSLFKYGRRSGMVTFDYTDAHHPLSPWPASREDFCVRDPESELWEFPIYSEYRWSGAFVTPNRIYRAIVGKLHKISDNELPRVHQPPTSAKKEKPGAWLFKKNAWKADFNQCSGRQLVRALLRAEKLVADDQPVPFILIGHSKIFTRWNALSIKPFLKFVANHPSRFGFGTFGMFEK